MNGTTTGKSPAQHKHSVSSFDQLGDFTTTWRVLPISAIAISEIAAHVAVTPLSFAEHSGLVLAPSSSQKRLGQESTREWWM